MRARTVAAVFAAAAALAACRPAGQTAAPAKSPTAGGVSQVSRSTSAAAKPSKPHKPSGPSRRPKPGDGHALTSVHDPGEVTGTEPAHCSYSDGGKLPDPRCTPGSRDPAVTQANLQTTICRSGYSRSVRPPESQTERFKFDEAYPAYGVSPSARTELDHLVSLELGGSNDASNLWPEVPPSPNQKDMVENALHRAVCSGKVTLAAAQEAIADDWMTAEAKLGIG
ncbi:MAG: hypothetical protein ACM3ML_26130 [Micromonosporaceae bacterium]